MWKSVRLLAVLLAAASLPLSLVEAQDDVLTGPALEKALAASASVSWTGKPLRGALDSLTENYRVATLLDRRVDPSQEMNLAVSGSLREILRQIAFGTPRTMLGITQVGSVVYLAPPEPVKLVRTLATRAREELDASKIPSRTRLSWARVQSIAWDDFTTPRELFEKVGQTWDAKIAGLELLPHDLLAAGNLPKLGLIDAATLLAVQYDLMLTVDQQDLTLQRIVPEQVVLERKYSGGSNINQTLATYEQAIPDAQISVQGNQIVVVARLEDHERIDGTAAKQQSVASTPGTEQYTFKATNAPLEQILGQFAKLLKLEFQYDNPDSVDLNQLISINVQDASMDELLRATLAPAGLTFKREAKLVRIMPIKKSAE